MDICKIGIYMWLIWLRLESAECRGTTGGGDSGSIYAPYKAKRYGGYYSTRYYSYRAAGSARYGRVYRGTRNYFTHYYDYMLTWLGSESFKVYKRTPSAYISVCRNYEANENGTFLGIFTCPLPFEPASHAYCCGYPNAQYCCRFWDLPCNVTAALICASMIIGILATLIYIIVRLCINRAQIRAEKRNLISNQSTDKRNRQRPLSRRRSSPAALMSQSGAANGSLKHCLSRNGFWR